MFNKIKIKDVKIRIGQSVKIIRKSNKLTQQELAELLDLSRITIQNLESGKNFTIDTLLKVLQHFDMLSILDEEIVKQTKGHTAIKSLY